MTVATGAGLQAGVIASWLLAAYGLSGVLTIALSLLHRRPLPIAFSVPAIVLARPALQAYSLAEVVGAYVASGFLILLLDVTGLLRRATAALPMPIVMAMVAGVFLPFGIGLVAAFEDALLTTAAMVAAFLGASVIGAGIQSTAGILGPGSSPG